MNPLQVFLATSIRLASWVGLYKRILIKAVIYSLYLGRFGNQADQFLGALAFAKHLNRTLVLPPWITYQYATPGSVSTHAHLQEYFNCIVTIQLTDTDFHFLGGEKGLDKHLGRCYCLFRPKCKRNVSLDSIVIFFDMKSGTWMWSFTYR